MMPRPHRLERTALLLILASVVLGVTPGLLSLGSAAPAAPPNPGAVALPDSSAGSGLPASPTPQVTCIPTNSSFGLFVTIDGQTGQNGTITAGPAPANVSVNVTFYGFPAPTDVSLAWGDQSTTAGRVNESVTAILSVGFSHSYSLPAVYDIQVSSNYTCTSPSGGFDAGGADWATPVYVYGVYGPNPINVTANVSVGPVPLAVNFTASVAGAPANATAVWTLWSPLGDQLTYSGPINGSGQASLDVDLTVPGSYFGEVAVEYPVTGLVYGAVLLPAVNVTPLALLTVQYVVTHSPSPWNFTYWANVTALNGSPYAGPGTIAWDFGNQTRGNTGFWEVGPTTGSPVWRVFYINYTGYGAFVATGELVRSDGVILAAGEAVVTIVNNSGGGPTPPILSLQPWGGNYTAPATVNITAVLLNGGNSSGGPPPPPPPPIYWLNVSSYPAAGGSVSIPNWTGNPTTLTLQFTNPGTYRVFGTVSQDENGTWVYIAGANFTLVVTSASAASPLMTSLSASPSNGSAPLNVSVSVATTGGTAPYDLALCVDWPHNTSPPGSSSCQSFASVTGWNGSQQAFSLYLATADNYTVYANVTDSSGGANSIWLPVTVTTSAPLALSAARAQALGLTATGATYAFTTLVSGGVAPYTIQWGFGDGTFGSSTNGATIQHTYTSSGSFTATLRVTDGTGASRSTSLGPFVVVLPSSAANWPASIGPVGSAAIGLGLVALGMFGVLVVRIQRRREARAWMRTLGPSEPPADHRDPPQ